MKKYIKVEWPESQIFQDEKFNNECYWWDSIVVFVPEDIYTSKFQNDN